MPVTVILSKTISVPAQAIGGGFYVTVILRDFCAKLFQPFNVHVDRTAADGAAAGQRYAGASAAGNQRSENQRGGAHGLDQFIGSFGTGDIFAVNRGAVLGASVAEFDLGAHGGEQVARGLNVAHLRNVFENDRFVGEQCGSHAGKRGVLCATDAHGAEQRLSAADYKFVHDMSPEKSILAGNVGWGRVIGRARTCAWERLGARRPIIDGQTADTFKLARIVGDQREAQAAGVGGDEKIVGSDHRATGSQIGTDFRVMQRCFVGEIQNST